MDIVIAEYTKQEDMVVEHLVGEARGDGLCECVEGGD